MTGRLGAMLRSARAATLAGPGGGDLAAEAEAASAQVGGLLGAAAGTTGGAAGKELPRLADGAEMDALWVPRKAAQQPASGVGVVVDGNVARRVRVSAGVVVSCETLQAGSPSDALAQALVGTKGARVVVLSGLLFARDVAVEPGPPALLPQVLLEVGQKAWPASKVVSVAGLVAQEGKAVLAGWESQGNPAVWAALAKHKARLVPLPFVVPDGAWLVVGAAATWVVLVEAGVPQVCRALKATSSDLGEVAAQTGTELARLAHEGWPVGAVQVVGVPLEETTSTAFARVGAHVVAPAPMGIARWEIPWAEQGPAALAAMAAVAQPSGSACLRSPDEIARLAEAPARRRRATVLALGTAAAAGVALVGVLPLVSARSALATARSDLSIAQANEASVERWLNLRSEARSLSGQVASVRAPDTAFAAAVALLQSTAPFGTSLGTVDVTSADGTVSLTAGANLPGASFEPVAAWQEVLEAHGATVQVTGESTSGGLGGQGTNGVGVSMTVSIPARRLGAPPRTGQQARRAGNAKAARPAPAGHPRAGAAGRKGAARRKGARG
jgi:hypothetical protein